MSLNNLSATNMSDALIDAGDFVINKRLVSNNQILYYTDPVTSIKTGYVWKGTLPHITSTNNPNTDGGISDTAWVPVIYSKLKEKMETEGLTLDWNAHLPTVEVAYGLTKNSLKMWKSGTTATSDDYWLYTDGTVWNGVGVLGSTPETSTGFEKITPNFNASIKTYSASATDGQTVFNIPFTFSTITVFVNGSIKLPGLNYTVSGNTVTFTTELEAGDLLYVFIGNPNISTNDKLNRIYTANALQGQTTIQVPYDFSTAIVYINGVLQNPSAAYSIGADRIITFSEELYQDDEIIVMLGDVVVQSDEYLLKQEMLDNGLKYIGLHYGTNTLQDAIQWISPSMMNGCPTDGISDSSFYFKQALSIALENNITFLIDNIYVVSEFIEINTTSPIKICGISPEISKIIFNNPLSYGLKINQTVSSNFITIENLSISTSAQIENIDALLTIDGSTQMSTQASAGKYLLSDRTIRRGNIYNISIDVISSGYFVNAMQIISWMNYSIDKIIIRGNRSNLSSQTNGILMTGDGFPVDMHFSNMWIYNVGRAINSVDYIEGLHISHFEFVNVLRGISGEYDPTYSAISESLCALYGPYISNGHINLGGLLGADSCIYIKNCTTPHINNLYLFASAGSDITNAYGIYMYNNSGGIINSVNIAGSGAANTKINNFGISIYNSKNMIISECNSTNSGGSVKVSGGSTNNIISSNIASNCTNCIYIDSTSDQLNTIAGSNKGISLTSTLIGGTYNNNNIEPLLYSRNYQLTVPAYSSGSTYSFNIPIVTGTYGSAPDLVTVNLPAEIIAIASYNKTESTSTSMRINLYFITSLSAGTYNLGITATMFGYNRTQ